ncbi:MAG TPA: XdhC family protein [Bacteroidales bacterium]|nr:XdhC family protein [Bacteroidales bacterium]
MTHEINELFQTLKAWQQAGKKAVLASVVALEGTSYRRPGVRMIIGEDGNSVGAVSGGCVENEIERQAQTVFKTGRSKVMTYDGRFRVGCDGILYLLIEPVFIPMELFNDFDSQLKNRHPFKLDTYYYHDVGEYDNLGTHITVNDKIFSLNPSFNPGEVNDQLCFSQSLDPLFRLYIFGAEHDAVKLSKAAKELGWNVTIVASSDESKSCEYFTGASSLITPSFQEIDTSVFDDHTAVVLMTHSYNKDVQYLMALKDSKPAYIGLLGSVSRRERVLSMLLEYCPDISTDFLDQIHGPAGINLGAESASEIAVSIVAEILSVIRHQEPKSLKDKTGSIHG